MSLLTQFYPGPGSGGGGLGGATVGMPSVVFSGLNSGPTFSSSIYRVNATYTYLPEVNGGVGSSFRIAGSLSLGSYSTITLNNVSLDSLSVPITCKKIILNNAILGQVTVDNINAQLEAIEGTGLITKMGFSGNSAPSFTSISSDIAFTLTNGSSIGTFDAQLLALDAASMNHILTSAVDNYAADISSGGNRSIDISGGTSAGTGALTAAGSAAVIALTGVGWTVTLNP
jgi:hypothetical protein